MKKQRTLKKCKCGKIIQKSKTESWPQYAKKEKCGFDCEEYKSKKRQSKNTFGSVESDNVQRNVTFATGRYAHLVMK